MSAESDHDSGGTVLNVYVPEHERVDWEQHADELGLEMSRYVREMVKSGRRPWYSENYRVQPEGDEPNQELEEQILAALSEAGPLSNDEVYEAITNQLQSRVDEKLMELREDNRIEQNPSGAFSLR